METGKRLTPVDVDKFVCSLALDFASVGKPSRGNEEMMNILLGRCGEPSLMSEVYDSMLKLSRVVLSIATACLLNDIGKITALAGDYLAELKKLCGLCGVEWGGYDEEIRSLFFQQGR